LTERLGRSDRRRHTRRRHLPPIESRAPSEETWTMPSGSVEVRDTPRIPPKRVSTGRPRRPDVFSRHHVTPPCRHPLTATTPTPTAPQEKENVTHIADKHSRDMDRGYHARLRAAAAAAASAKPLSSAETNVRFASDPSSKLSKETRDAARLEALRSVEETLARSRRSSTSPPGSSSAPDPSVARAGSFNDAASVREQPRRPPGLERSVSDATNVSSRRDAIPPAAYYPPRSSLFNVDIDTDSSESSESGSPAASDKENENTAVSETNAADADPETDAWTPPPPDSPAAASEDGSVEDTAEKGAEEEARAAFTAAEHAEAPTTPNAAEGDSNNKGYRGVSEWMDAVVAQAKAVRQATGMSQHSKPSAQTLASAAASGNSLRAAESIGAAHLKSPPILPESGTDKPPSAEGSSLRKRVDSSVHGAVSKTLDDVTDEAVTRMTQAQLVQLVNSRGVTIKELTEQLDGAVNAHEETAAALARANGREETLEEELRRSAERCSEVEAGRRSARAALAEMASQNARLVSAFSAKKEEVRSLKSEVAEAKKGDATDAADIAQRLLAAQSEAASLREAAARKDADVAQAEATAEREKASARAATRELEKLKDRLAQTERSQRRLDADHAAQRARVDDEIAIAVRVARKELDVERASFNTERARWEAERKRWSGEIASLKDAAKRAASDAAAARHEARAAPRDSTGSASASGRSSSTTTGGSGPSNPTGTGSNPSAPYRDPYRDPFRSTNGNAPGPQTNEPKANNKSTNWSSKTHKTKTPTKGKHSAGASAKSPGPNASPRARAEHHKVKGNNEFHAKRYEAALAQYSAGLALPFHDDSFRAILHANRAAALQAMRQYCDAVMDCCASHLLDSKYLRALQRRADAYLSMGDWPNAANDLESLAPHMGAECATKLAEARRKVKKGTTCDHYAVLGLGHEASGSEIKQAYRQLALKMHPDKAPKPELRSQAEAMFKHVAQAYATLSDATQRKRYDSTVVMSRFRRSGGY